MRPPFEMACVVPTAVASCSVVAKSTIAADLASCGPAANVLCLPRPRAMRRRGLPVEEVRFRCLFRTIWRHCLLLFARSTAAQFFTLTFGIGGDEARPARKFMLGRNELYWTANKRQTANAGKQRWSQVVPAIVLAGWSRSVPKGPYFWPYLFFST